MQREFDVLVWGATGFTGRLVAAYLHRSYADSNLTWAMGGRNAGKLDDVADAMGAEHVAKLTADAHDLDALRALVGRARVVLTTVGPYAKYGSELVQACAEQGTHYCDLTGELHWMRRMIDAHHATAQASGARIVFTCGFDSIPSDLGVYHLQREMLARHGVPARQVRYRVRSFSGGFSGGTVDSMMTMMAEAERDPAVRQIMDDPYALNPIGAERGLDGPDRTSPVYDDDFQRWVAPFVMSAINTRVVRRTNALLGFRYGHDFRYEEGMLMPAGPLGFAAAAGTSFGLGAINALTAMRGTRNLLGRVLPKPGEGPSAEARERGHYTIDLIGKHPDDPGLDLRASITGKGDPGYASTARMLGESAVALAQDGPAVDGGFWTPASALGDVLLERLPANAGISFELA